MNNEPDFVPIPAEKLGVPAELKPTFGAVPNQNARVVATFPDEPKEESLPTVVSIDELSSPAARYPGAARSMPPARSGLTPTDDERLTSLEKRLSEIEGMGGREIQLALADGSQQFERINEALAAHASLSQTILKRLDSLEYHRSKLTNEMARTADLEARLFKVETWIRQQNLNPHTGESV